MTAKPTVWVLGDQLNRGISSLANRAPVDCRVLIVESEHKLSSKRWHVQRLHLVVSAMAHFAERLAAEGFEVDYRRAPTMAAGLGAHCEEFGVERVVAMEPMSWSGRSMLERLGVETITNNQFLCDYRQFAHWAEDRRSLRMEDFYRWQRQRLQVLMALDGPCGRRWNFDHDNRERPPTDGRRWPRLTEFELDATDHRVLERLPETWGAAPSGTWPTTREQALIRLQEFLDDGLAVFGLVSRGACSRSWLRPPHRAADGPGQPGTHRRGRSTGDDRVDVGQFR